MKARLKFSDLTRHYGSDRRDVIERIKTQLRVALETDQPAR